LIPNHHFSSDSDRVTNFREIEWLMLAWSFRECKLSSSSCPLLSTFFCDFDSSKGRAKEKGDGTTARAATRSLSAEGRRAGGTTSYGGTTLVQVIPAKETGFPRGGKALSSKQGRRLCSVLFISLSQSGTHD